MRWSFTATRQYQGPCDCGISAVKDEEAEPTTRVGAEDCDLEQFSQRASPTPGVHSSMHKIPTLNTGGYTSHTGTRLGCYDCANLARHEQDVPEPDRTHLQAKSGPPCRAISLRSTRTHAHTHAQTLKSTQKKHLQTNPIDNAPRTKQAQT